MDPNCSKDTGAPPVYSCEKAIKPGSLKCAMKHCNNYPETQDWKAYCKCIDWQGNPIPDCQPKGNTVPIQALVCYNKVTGEQCTTTAEECQEKRDKDRNWLWTSCYCCCSCFAWNTLVLVGENKVKVIQDIEEDEEVYTASIKVDQGQISLTWQPTKVGYSDGTSPGGIPQEMVVIHCQDINAEITATPDQLFLLPNGKLKAAKQLTPNDELVDYAGQPVVIETVRLVKSTDGIHHLGLGEAPPTTEVPIDGHLFLADGVISGDFWLQVTYHSNEMSRFLVDDFDDLPVIGSEAYAKQKGFTTSLFSAVAEGVEPRPILNPYIELHEEILHPRVPHHARRFLTDKQAKDIKKKAPAFPISDGVNLETFNWLSQMFSAFFPDINFFLAWEDETPNLYGFVEYGIKTVYVSGRLLRVQGIYTEGVGMIMAHGVAMFYGNSVSDHQGYACTGQADYFGAGFVLRQLFYQYWPEIASDGYSQIKALFGYISPKNQGGDPEDPCRYPSIECRLKCLSNALGMGRLPQCAGAPLPATLQLESAEYSTAEGEQSIVAVFNESVSTISGQETSNYTIMPETAIYKALRDGADKKKVVLTVTLPDPPEGEYTLTVANILSAEGSNLNPDSTEVTFTVPPPVA